MKRPTARQIEVLAFIDEHTSASGYPPTLREIGARFGIRSTNGVNDHLLSLQRKGLIERDDHQARSVRVSPAGRDLLGYAPKRSGEASVARHVVVNFGMRCGKCDAHTFDLDKPCVICRLERKREVA